MPPTNGGLTGFNNYDSIYSRHSEGGYKMLTREKAIQTTINNLIQAQILLPNETDKYRDKLTSYSDNELLTTMVESHMLREEYFEREKACCLKEEVEPPDSELNFLFLASYPDISVSLN